jgi:ubiquinone/menaquinone biosynthesis C-methylase UbiE
MIHNVMRNRGRNMKQNVYDQETFYKGYKAIRERAYNYNNLLEQPALQAVMPDVVGKIVLDIGCGSGDFAAKCVRNGATRVIGIDISANMMNDAKEKYSDGRLEFIQAAFEDVELEPASIDIVVSSLAFHYMTDFHAAMEKVSTVLRDGGVLVFSCEHPIVTANKGGEDWVLDEASAIRHFAVDRYQDEGQRTQTWIVEGVVTYHRTTATIVNTIVDCGLMVEQLVEPTPTEEAVALLPSLAKEFRRPSFLIVKGRKR